MSNDHPLDHGGGQEGQEEQEEEAAELSSVPAPDVFAATLATATADQQHVLFLILISLL